MPLLVPGPAGAELRHQPVDERDCRDPGSYPPRKSLPSSAFTPCTTTSRAGNTACRSAPTCPAPCAAPKISCRSCAQNLGIQVGETTPDGLISIEAVMCLAGCDRAPMFQVQDGNGLTYHENQTVESALEIGAQAACGQEGWQSDERSTSCSAIARSPISTSWRFTASTDGFRAFKKAVTEHEAGGGDRDGESFWPARARRGGFPHRDEVVIHG